MKKPKKKVFEFVKNWSLAEGMVIHKGVRIGISDCVFNETNETISGSDCVWNIPVEYLAEIIPVKREKKKRKQNKEKLVLEKKTKSASARISDQKI